MFVYNLLCELLNLQTTKLHDRNTQKYSLIFSEENHQTLITETHQLGF